MKPYIFYTQFLNFKLWFILAAAGIVIGALVVTNVLVGKLKTEERSRMEIWAEATKQLPLAESTAHINLILSEINGNKTIPVVLVDENDNLVSYDYGFRNIKIPDKNREEFIKEKIQDLKQANPPIAAKIDDRTTYYVYYDVSSQIKNLIYFSYILFIVVSLFFIVALVFFTYTKKTEQNQVWVGLSKETAHQLGTPISSLLAWVEILRSKYASETLIAEMTKDVNRLGVIAERFSKIGSCPELQCIPLVQTVDNAIQYMKNRTSSKVEVNTYYHISQLSEAKLNLHLFEWVIENLYKNAVDAMHGEGRIDITVSRKNEYYRIDITDTGKGIPPTKFKTVFEPGYTTKKRGWGLGLSLAKRIVEDYHQGKIFVENSEVDKGTTFRIMLKI